MKKIPREKIWHVDLARGFFYGFFASLIFIFTLGICNAAALQDQNFDGFSVGEINSQGDWTFNCCSTSTHVVTTDIYVSSPNSLKLTAQTGGAGVYYHPSSMPQINQYAFWEFHDFTTTGTTDSLNVALSDSSLTTAKFIGYIRIYADNLYIVDTSGVATLVGPAPSGSSNFIRVFIDNTAHTFTASVNTGALSTSVATHSNSVDRIEFTNNATGTHSTLIDNITFNGGTGTGTDTIIDPENGSTIDATNFLFTGTCGHPGLNYALSDNNTTPPSVANIVCNSSGTWGGTFQTVNSNGVLKAYFLYDFVTQTYIHTDVFVSPLAVSDTQENFWGNLFIPSSQEVHDSLYPLTSSIDSKYSDILSVGSSMQAEFSGFTQENPDIEIPGYGSSPDAPLFDWSAGYMINIGNYTKTTIGILLWFGLGVWAFLYIKNLFTKQ